MAFLPDGRMLITEKAGKLFIAKASGEKMEVTGVPAVQFGGQNGLLGVYLAPTYAKDHQIYLTYSEPGEDPATSSLALAPRRAEHRRDHGLARQSQGHLGAIRSRAKGGQVGATIAFSPDKKYLFLTAGERQRFTPAQDPNQPAGKILRLTLDGKPGARQSDGREDRRGVRRRDRSAAQYRSREDRARRADLHFHRTQSDAVGDLEAPAIARLTGSPSPLTAAFGRSSMGRAAAMNSI